MCTSERAAMPPLRINASKRPHNCIFSLQLQLKDRNSDIECGISVGQSTHKPLFCYKQLLGTAKSWSRPLVPAWRRRARQRYRWRARSLLCDYFPQDLRGVLFALTTNVNRDGDGGYATHRNHHGHYRREGVVASLRQALAARLDGLRDGGLRAAIAGRLRRH